jgi:hypothetical protein
MKSTPGKLGFCLLGQALAPKRANRANQLLPRISRLPFAVGSRIVTGRLQPGLREWRSGTHQAIRKELTMELDDPVEVYSLKDAHVAEIIRLALEEEGISCWLDGEYQGGLTGLFDIQVMVRSADAERARALIEEHAAHQLAEEQVEAEDEAEDGDVLDERPGQEDEVPPESDAAGPSRSE